MVIIHSNWIVVRPQHAVNLKKTQMSLMETDSLDCLRIDFTSRRMIHSPRIWVLTLNKNHQHLGPWNMKFGRYEVSFRRELIVFCITQ